MSPHEATTIAAKAMCRGNRLDCWCVLADAGNKVGAELVRKQGCHAINTYGAVAARVIVALNEAEEHEAA